MENLEVLRGDQLILRGLLFHGFHGVKPEERKLGQKFLIDVCFFRNTVSNVLIVCPQSQTKGGRAKDMDEWISPREEDHLSSLSPVFTFQIFIFGPQKVDRTESPSSKVAICPPFIGAK